MFSHIYTPINAYLITKLDDYFNTRLIKLVGFIVSALVAFQFLQQGGHRVGLLFPV